MPILPQCQWSDDKLTDRVCQEIIEWVKRHRPERLILDFGLVDVYRDRFAVPLISTRKTLDGYGGRFVVAAMRDEVRSSFRLFGIEPLFVVVDSVDEAIDVLNNADNR